MPMRPSLRLIPPPPALEPPPAKRAVRHAPVLFYVAWSILSLLAACLWTARAAKEGGIAWVACGLWWFAAGMAMGATMRRAEK